MGSDILAQGASRPALVPVSLAATEHLHVLTHRATLAARNVEDWWGTALETALAVVALARHSHIHQEDAERAFDRLLRWCRDENPRRTSDDVTALALAARAASDLQRQNPGLTERAARAVDDLARRRQDLVPHFHLALCVWALDSLVPDRGAAPWPAVRERLSRSSPSGVDEPVHYYANAICQRTLNANSLVQGLLARIGPAPGLIDSCILLWLIKVANEALTLHLPRTDNALQLLIQRRSDLVERLVGEVDERTFDESSEASEFGSEEEDYFCLRTYLSPFEATLLDFALASRDKAHAWLTFEEAEHLFDDRVANARLEIATTRRRLFRVVGCLTAVIGISLGAVLWLGLRRAGVDTNVANPATVALMALLFAVSVSVTARGRQTPRLLEPLGLLFASTAILATAVAFNQTMKRPLISDEGGLIGGVLISAVASVVWKAIGWLNSSQRT